MTVYLLNERTILIRRLILGHSPARKSLWYESETFMGMYITVRVYDMKVKPVCECVLQHTVTSTELFSFYRHSHDSQSHNI